MPASDYFLVLVVEARGSRCSLLCGMWICEPLPSGFGRPLPLGERASYFYLWQSNARTTVRTSHTHTVKYKYNYTDTTTHLLCVWRVASGEAAEGERERGREADCQVGSARGVCAEAA